MVAPRWAAARRPMQRLVLGREIAVLLWGTSEPVVDWGRLDIATRNRLAKRATVSRLTGSPDRRSKGQSFSSSSMTAPTRSCPST